MGGGLDLKLIVAMTPDRVIGKGNELPAPARGLEAI